MTTRLSIGVPVYNGENFLADALQSLLDQTWTEFHVVISDNGSTDGTEAICREFAHRDERVRYVRHETNRGAGWNFEYVRSLATGTEFYKWAAHDDLLAPTFLARCIAALDADPHAVLAYSGVAAIDESGDVTRLKHSQVHASGASASRRFRQVVLSDASCNAIFGVIRRTALECTRGQGDYIASDRVLLAELALQGTFVEVPEILFFNRNHAARSVRLPALREQSAWFAPSKPQQVLPTWRVWHEYLNAARCAPLPRSARRRAVLQLPWYVRTHGRQLAKDLVLAGRRALRRP